MTWAQELKKRLEAAIAERTKLQNDAEFALAELSQRLSADSRDLAATMGDRWEFYSTLQSKTTPEGHMLVSVSLPRNSNRRCGIMACFDQDKLRIVTFTSDGNSREGVGEHSTVDDAHASVRSIIEQDMLG